MMVKNEAKDIGVDVEVPDGPCEDRYCPFHGTLSTRGQIINGQIESIKMDGSVIVKKDYRHYVPKFERYEKRRSHYPAHLPPCIEAEEGDRVKIMETRPLSKSISFVVIESERQIEGEIGGSTG